MYDQDNRPNKQTPLMEASTEAWRALHDEKPEGLANKPLAQSLYDWYKQLWPCMMKGEVPRRVLEVRTNAPCCLNRFE